MKNNKQIAKEYQERVFVKTEYLSNNDYRDALEAAVLYGMSQNNISQREHFAAMAMQGLLAGVKNVNPMTATEIPQNIATWAVACADALINQLNKEETK